MADTLRRKLGFERIHSDAGVYVLRWQGGNQTEIILILYVNNLLLMGNDLSMINKIKKKLGEAYHMKDLGAAQSYLGIQITRDLLNQQVRSADYLRMQSVTACNDTCIRGD